MENKPIKRYNKEPCVDCGCKVSRKSIRCRKCNDKYISGERNPRFTKIDRNCTQCRGFFTLHFYRKDDKLRGKFCSKECYWLNMKGRSLSKEQIIKIIKSQVANGGRERMLQTAFKKGNKPMCPYKKGHKPWNTGIARPEMTGPLHPLWNGGPKTASMAVRHSREYRLWREAVFARDNFTCQDCKDRGGKLNAHHIKPFSLFPELRLAIDNGVTLCKTCHLKTDTWGSKVLKYNEQAT